jgi:hypothetical protein
VLVDVRDEFPNDALRSFPSLRHFILTHRHMGKHEAAIERAFGLLRRGTRLVVVTWLFLK